MNPDEGPDPNSERMKPAPPTSHGPPGGHLPGVDDNTDVEDIEDILAWLHAQMRRIDDEAPRSSDADLRRRLRQIKIHGARARIGHLTGRRFTGTLVAHARRQYPPVRYPGRR